MTRIIEGLVPQLNYVKPPSQTPTYRCRKTNLLEYRSYGRKKIARAARDLCESSSDEEAFDSPNKYSAKRRKYPVRKFLVRSETNGVSFDCSESEKSYFEAISTETQNSISDRFLDANDETSAAILDSVTIFNPGKAPYPREYERTTNSDSDKRRKEQSSTEDDSDLQNSNDDSNDWVDETTSATDSDSSQSNDDEEICVFEKPLYKNANITVGASAVLVVQFCQKYKLSQKARNDLLNLVKQHCPLDGQSQFPKSYKKMLALVMPVLQKGEKQIVCAVCNKVIPLNSTTCKNEHAEKRIVQENPYFYNIPLESQLKMLLEGNNYIQSVIKPF